MSQYCPELFNNLYVEKYTQNQVMLTSCCLQQRDDKNLADQIDFHFPLLEQQRQHFKSTGILPTSCATCTTSEANGIRSKRLWLLEETASRSTHAKLTRLNYNCDVICNLKCIICSSFASSAWIEDEIKLGLPVKTTVRPTKHNQLIFDIDLSDLTDINFNGGEPLMTNDHLRVLDYIIENYHPENIKLLYNSNGTFSVTDEMIKRWNKFKRVVVTASIDATHEQFEYTRFPANWQTVCDNLKHMQARGIILFFHAVVGIHNIMYMDKWMKFIKQEFPDSNMGITASLDKLEIADFPEHLLPQLTVHLNCMPDSDIKNSLLSMCQGINRHNTNWITYLNKLDQIRGNSWTKTFDRMYSLDPAYFDTFKSNHK